MSTWMGFPQLIRRSLVLLLSVPFIALVVSHSIPWMAYPRLACPLDAKDSAFEEMGFHRSQFPDDFVFGVATSAFQVEGAVHEGGRGPSIWDNFSHTPGKIVDGGLADVTIDQYHRYEEDMDLMKEMHADAHRFSIAWTRIFPDGKGPVPNKEGVAYYNRFIDSLIRRGIQPYATLYHWDLPQHLEESIGGWLSPDTAKHFAEYAEVCFAAFGDRVKHWITVNEPQQFAWLGYGEGIHAPGRTSNRDRSVVGNTSTEPYIVGHNVLKAHGAAVDVYRQKFQAKQRGVIGIAVDCEWGEPLTDSLEDLKARERRILFQVGWFLDPIFFGDYPEAMRERAGDRLPKLTASEKALLRNSVDFIGLNHYTTKWVTNVNYTQSMNLYQDMGATTAEMRDNVAIGPHAYSAWLRIVPWGIERLLLWLWDRYKTPLYVTESGMDTENNQSVGQPLPSHAFEDTARMEYYRDYLQAILSAISKGANVRAYFAWSFVDNFEWAMGYTSRFGLVYCDFSSLERYPKQSYRWFQKFLKPRDVDVC